MNCMKSNDLKVQWNGSMIGEIISSRGIRRGDPISSYLLCFVLNDLIIWSKIWWGSRQWKPISIARGCPLLSHIFFIDDLILFEEATHEHMEMVKNCLDRFRGWSGQKINYEKSKVMFSSNVTSNLAKEIATFTNIPCTDDIWVYLSLLMIHGRFCKAFFKYLLDKLNKETSWLEIWYIDFCLESYLSKAHLKHFTFYVMKVMKLPVAVCDEMDWICRSFIWSQNEWA